MAKVNVSKVLSSPRFRSTFVVHRKTGVWNAGRFEQTEAALTFAGVVIPGGTDDIIQTPEADRTSQLMIFVSKNQMYITGADRGGTSDEIEYRGLRYKIHRVMEWQEFGYYRAYGISMGGD